MFKNKKILSILDYYKNLWALSYSSATNIKAGINSDNSVDIVDLGPIIDNYGK